MLLVIGMYWLYRGGRISSPDQNESACYKVLAFAALEQHSSILIFTPACLDLRVLDICRQNLSPAKPILCYTYKGGRALILLAFIVITKTLTLLRF